MNAILTYHKRRRFVRPSHFQISGARAKIRARVTVDQVTVGQNLIHLDLSDGRPVVEGEEGAEAVFFVAPVAVGEERAHAVFYAASVVEGRRGARQYSMQLQWSIGDGEEAVESCCRRRASQRELKGCPPEADTILLF